MSFTTFDLLTLKQPLDGGSIIQESNQNKVLIVLSANEDKDLRSSLLPKIMKAVNIDLVKQTTIVNAPHYGINIINLISDQNIAKVISFGVSPKDLSLNLSAAAYKLNKIGQIQFLFSDNLEVISTNQDRKKALWSNLKDLFPS